MTKVLEQAAQAALSYLNGLPTRAVRADPAAVAGLAGLGGELPATGEPADAVIERLDRLASPATVASAGPRYFGFVTGGAVPVSLAANWLAGAWDQNAFSTVSSPVGSAIEAACEPWVVELLGLPPGTACGFVTGATMANFTALAAARNAVLRRAGWDVEADGLFGAPSVTVVVGGEAHASLLKALRLCGFGAGRVLVIPADDQGRMRADDLPPLEGPAIVCLQAGNVNSGAFDPAAAIVPWAHRHGAWVHVDGAFGLWAAAAPARRHLMDGFADCDSWAVDGHKWLNVPYDSGLALVRDREALRRAMGISAAYLPEHGPREPYDHTPEASRRPRGVEVWAALRALGRDGIADLVECCCRHAERFAVGLTEAGYAVLNEVALNQVVVSFGSDDVTERVIAGVQADGTCWCGGTAWQGRRAMRISVSSWATTEADVEMSLAAILRVARANSMGEPS